MFRITVRTFLTMQMSHRKNVIDDSSPQNPHNIKKDAELGNVTGDAGRIDFAQFPMFQKGVLRTNCIDCLDRTNVAQYAYGLVALAHQLHALGFIDAPKIDLDAPVADDLMAVYESMGDTLALQYGGSTAHNKVILLWT